MILITIWSRSWHWWRIHGWHGIFTVPNLQWSSTNIIHIYLCKYTKQNSKRIPWKIYQSINVKQIPSIFSMGEHGCSHRPTQVMMTPNCWSFWVAWSCYPPIYPRWFRPPWPTFLGMVSEKHVTPKSRRHKKWPPRFGGIKRSLWIIPGRCCFFFKPRLGCLESFGVKDFSNWVFLLRLDCFGSWVYLMAYFIIPISLGRVCQSPIFVLGIVFLRESLHGESTMVNQH